MQFLSVLAAGGLLIASSVACRPADGEGEGSRAATSDQPAVSRVDTITVELHEWRIVSSRDSLPAGRHVFRVINRAGRRHELEIENEEGGVDVGEIAPGAQVEVGATLKPGVYQMFCPLAGPEGSHSRHGMMRPLVVM